MTTDTREATTQWPQTSRWTCAPEGSTSQQQSWRTGAQERKCPHEPRTSPRGDSPLEVTNVSNTGCSHPIPGFLHVGTSVHSTPTWKVVGP